MKIVIHCESQKRATEHLSVFLPNTGLFGFFTVTFHGTFAVAKF